MFPSLLAVTRGSRTNCMIKYLTPCAGTGVSMLLEFRMDLEVGSNGNVYHHDIGLVANSLCFRSKQHRWYRGATSLCPASPVQ